MFWKKASDWNLVAPNSPSAIRFGVAAAKGFEKLVIIPNDPASKVFLSKVGSLYDEVISEGISASAVNEIADELDAAVAKFGRDQRLAIEDSLGLVYEGLRDILQSLEGAIASSEKLEVATEDSSARLLSLQNAKNYDEVVAGLKNEIMSLNKAVSQHRSDAKLIRKVASNHVEQLRTKLKVAEKAVKTDPLTKLGNRNTFDLQLTFAISRVAQDEPFALAIIDVDSFKGINDEYGHLAGDGALVEIAKHLSETFAQAGSSVIRFGGDEFAVLYKGNQLQMHAKLERVNSMLAKSAYSSNGQKINLQVSFGCIQLTKNHTPDSAFSDADAEMYVAKKAKRRAA